MTDVNLTVTRVIERVRAMRSYLGKDLLFHDMVFVASSPKQGEICVSKNDHGDNPSTPYLFDFIGEVEREGSYCSPEGSYDPSPLRRSPRFPQDITSAKIKLSIREISNPRFRPLVRDDWAKYMKNIDALHKHAFAADPASMPMDRTNPVRYRRIAVQHALLIPRESQAQEPETTETDNNPDPDTEPPSTQPAIKAEGSTTGVDDSASTQAVDGSSASESDSDVPARDERKPAGPDCYSNEGWPVAPDGAWRAELDSVSDKYKIDPLVAYLIETEDGDGEPIPPTSYSELIPGSIVHIRMSVAHFLFSQPKTVLVGKIEEVNVLQQSTPVPESPTKKRFYEKHTSAPSPKGSPSKKSRFSA